MLIVFLLCLLGAGLAAGAGPDCSSSSWTVSPTSYLLSTATLSWSPELANTSLQVSCCYHYILDWTVKVRMAEPGKPVRVVRLAAGPGSAVVELDRCSVIWVSLGSTSGDTGEVRI